MTAALDVVGLSRAFGGVRAIDGLTFDVPAGTVHAIIGPNGAGKTTLVNLVTGLYAADAGSIRLFGAVIDRLPPEGRAAHGLARTFQAPQLCANLNILDNVLIGAHRTLRSSLLAGMLGLPSIRKADAAARERARELLTFVGIDEPAHTVATELPYGGQKRLEIARALASQPRLVLLDEPAAGLQEAERRAIETLIRRVAESGTTVVLIEHDMRLVMAVSDRILVLDHGARLALGPAAEVRQDPAVIEAYLGSATT